MHIKNNIFQIISEGLLKHLSPSAGIEGVKTQGQQLLLYQKQEPSSYFLCFIVNFISASLTTTKPMLATF